MIVPRQEVTEGNAAVQEIVKMYSISEKVRGSNISVKRSLGLVGGASS